jgi:hypothetical protein
MIESCVLWYGMVARCLNLDILSFVHISASLLFFPPSHVLNCGIFLSESYILINLF